MNLPSSTYLFDITTAVAALGVMISVLAFCLSVSRPRVIPSRFRTMLLIIYIVFMSIVLAWICAQIWFWVNLFLGNSQ